MKALLELEKAMNKLDNCIGDCSQETADAISEIYNFIDDFKKGSESVKIIDEPFDKEAFIYIPNNK
tara:strand:- start:138 stop:335 length:198 start_codon:yes stop_codon:yes gene_type:complete